MQTYISLLRGINVSGHKLIKMDDLKKAYGELKFFDIRTYLQSGNVIFRGPAADTKTLSSKITNKIRESFGFDVPVIVLTVDALKEIIRNNPLIVHETADSSGFAVTILSERIKKADDTIFQQNLSVGEAFYIADDAVYLYCPNGYGRTKLSNSFIERKLKVVATTRNWRTANELVKLAEGW